MDDEEEKGTPIPRYPFTNTKQDTFNKRPPIIQTMKSKQLKEKSYNVNMHPTEIQRSEDYPTTEELLPLENPETELHIAIESLGSSDWAKQFDACTVLRRCCINNPEAVFALKSGQIHKMSLYFVKIADSLRSSLVKNCILALIGN